MTTDARKALESAREEIDLEPCPMCRGAARINRRSGVTGRVCRTRYYRETVACKSCKLSTAEFKTPGKAVAAWNRRTAIDAALASGEQGWRTDMATLPRDATILIAVERRNGQPMFGDRQRETYPAYVDEAKRLCDARTFKPDPGFSGEHFRTVAWRPLPAPPAPETRS